MPFPGIRGGGRREIVRRRIKVRIDHGPRQRPLTAKTFVGPGIAAPRGRRCGRMPEPACRSRRGISGSGTVRRDRRKAPVASARGDGAPCHGIKAAVTCRGPVRVRTGAAVAPRDRSKTISGQPQENRFRSNGTRASSERLISFGASTGRSSSQIGTTMTPSPVLETTR